MMKRSTKAFILTVLSCCLFAAAAKAAKAAEPYREQEILFSVEDSFSEEDIFLELSVLGTADIYFTLDGSEPSDEDELYQDGIFLEAGDQVTAYPVRAVAYYSDGRVSEVYTKTYFAGAGVSGRFSTTVISITGEYEDLFDYETGILVTGWFRDNYAAHNPDTELTDYDPANYNVRGDASERTVYVEAWDADGNELLGQQMGLRVNGGLSRGSDVKSLRLIARDEYGLDRIQFDFFADITDPGRIEVPAENVPADGEEDLEPDYDQRVVLRNHGNDTGLAYLRNELAQALASDAGYPFTQRFTAASVWINGEYYGFEWLEEYYDDVYLDSYYGTGSNEGSWQIIEAYDSEEDEEVWWEEKWAGYLAGELTEEEEAAEQEKEESAGKASEDLEYVLSFADKDLTDDAVFAELDSLMDIDNYLSYCAIELYLANSDWPENNIKAFRWYAADDEYSAQDGTDGKWRFLLYDLDMSMAQTSTESYDTKSLALALGAEEGARGSEEVPLLRALLMRGDMRERFCEIMEEYMEGAFGYTHVAGVLGEIEEEMEGELDFQIQEEAGKEAEDGEYDYQLYYDYYVGVHNEEIESIKEFFQNRAAVMEEELDSLEEYLK